MTLSPILQKSAASPQYVWYIGTMVTDAILDECARLYSDHYGTWSEKAPSHAGQPIRLSADRIRNWLNGENTGIYCARVDNALVGYAIASTVQVPDYGKIAWVTQLVVHGAYRQQDVAKRLLFTIWGLSDHFAWGLISANPFAIRALEKATRRRCTALRIKKNSRKILSVGKETVPYVTEDSRAVIEADRSVINTKFYADHSQLDTMLEKAVAHGVPWTLGSLDEGWEWFAFTFRDQDQLQLTPVEINKMLAASDQMVHQAYARMDLSSTQRWMAHTEKEVPFILQCLDLPPGASVIDFGCGIGRHAIGLAKANVAVTGIDYVERNIKMAIADAESQQAMSATFLCADCRKVQLSPADAVICLYDVVGSYAENDQNVAILRNIAHHIKPGGALLLSVMNYDRALRSAKHTFTLQANPDRLLTLPPSQTMETTGDVFNPDFYAVDTDTQVVYRKEQFLHGRVLPQEILVRDRRFRVPEIAGMCKSVGLQVQWSRYVSAGRWSESLEGTDPKAKEILLLCRKPIEAPDQVPVVRMLGHGVPVHDG